MFDTLGSSGILFIGIGTKACRWSDSQHYCQLSCSRDRPSFHPTLGKNKRTCFRTVSTSQEETLNYLCGRAAAGGEVLLTVLSVRKEQKMKQDKNKNKIAHGTHLLKSKMNSKLNCTGCIKLSELRCNKRDQ